MSQSPKQSLEQTKARTDELTPISPNDWSAHIWPCCDWGVVVNHLSNTSEDDCMVQTVLKRWSDASDIDHKNNPSLHIPTPAENESKSHQNVPDSGVFSGQQTDIVNKPTQPGEYRLDVGVFKQGDWNTLYYWYVGPRICVDASGKLTW